ncbi:Hemolymph proteinase 19, partial [Operophtera brumata]
MPVVSQETCIRSYSEFFVRFTSAYTYCAGFRDGTSVCNGDSGGGMVFKIGSAWYVRGLVSVSVARENEYRCDPSHYVIFTDLAKFLPWIREN